MSCDVLAQDCPVGAKCLPTQVDHIAILVEDDVESWCSMLAADPVGFQATCTVDHGGYRDATASYENCDAGLLCWGVNDSEGRCARLCTLSDPACPDDFFCAQGPGLNGVVCVSTCDPLAQDCAFASDACFLLDRAWGCYPRDMSSVGTLH